MNISTREMDGHIGAFAKCVNDGNAPDFCLSQVILSASFIARGKTLEEAAAKIEGGYFLHEEAPDARLARSAAKAIRALSALSQPASAHSKCAARGDVGANDPQDCDWPLCGCDEHANKVIAALEECGYLVEQPASAPAAQENIFWSKEKNNSEVRQRYDELMHEGKRGHYETLFKMAHEIRKQAMEEAEKMFIERAENCENAACLFEDVGNHESANKYRQLASVQRETAHLMKSLAAQPQEGNV